MSLQVSADLPDMDLDRMRISQALGNVLSNAINYTEAGGNIVLRAGLESDEARWLSRSSMTGSASTPQTFPTSSTASTVLTSLVVVG